MEQRFGKGDLAWFEALLPGVASHQALTVFYDEGGQIPTLSVMRTRNVPVGSMASADIDVVVVDNPDGPTTGYGHYTEVRMMKEAASGSIAQGPEIDCWSDKPTADVTPFSPNTPGMVEAFRTYTFVDKAGFTPFPISVAWTLGGWFKKGINVMMDFLGPVVSLGPGKVLAQWFTSPTKDFPLGQEGSQIRCDGADPKQAMRMVFFDGGMALQSADGVNRHIFWNDGRYTNDAPKPG